MRRAAEGAPEYYDEEKRRPSVLESDTGTMDKWWTSILSSRTNDTGVRGLLSQPGSARIAGTPSIGLQCRTQIPGLGEDINPQFGNQIRGLGRTHGIQCWNHALGLGRYHRIVSQWIPVMAPNVGFRYYGHRDFDHWLFGYFCLVALHGFNKEYIAPPRRSTYAIYDVHIEGRRIWCPNWRSTYAPSPSIWMLQRMPSHACQKSTPSLAEGVFDIPLFLLPRFSDAGRRSLLSLVSDSNIDGRR